MQILINVLRNLDNVTLVKCTTVNKQWFREGRKLLESRRCYAHINEFRPCEDLQILDESLEAAQEPGSSLYNGLSLRIDAEGHSIDCPGPTRRRCDGDLGCTPRKKLRYNSILKNLSLKYLKINWHGRHSLRICPTFQFLTELLLQNRYTLESRPVGHFGNGWIGTRVFWNYESYEY